MNLNRRMQKLFEADDGYYSIAIPDYGIVGEPENGSPAKWC